jgi:CRP/FNR family transcriptional regulator, cyclic AMP receptor protein
MLPSSKTFNIDGLLDALGTKGKTLSFPKNRVIFSQGDRSDAVFYIDNGNVKMTVTSRRGKEAIVSVFDQGDFFGESCITSDRPVREQTATALTDVRLLAIHRSAVVNALRGVDDAFYAFISSVVTHNARVQENFANTLLDSGEKRLARALLAISRLNQRHGPPYANITQQDWADMIGTTRQRVNVLLKEFRKSGLIGDGRVLKVKPNILNLIE